MEVLADESPGIPVSLPVRMLESICGGTNLAYFMDTAPYSAKDVIDVYTIEKVSGFFVEFSRNELDDIKKVFYVTFEDVAYKVYIRLDDIDFFDREKVEADWQEHFPLIQPGDLAISVHPTYLLADIHDLFEAGFERAKWDLQLPEGTLFSVLNSVRIDDICFVKVLYRNRAMWAFGALMKTDTLEAGQPNYHFI
jgi:hypothetical protein